MPLLDSLGRAAKSVVVPTTLAISGCGALPDGANTPNDEQYDRIGYLVDVADDARPIVREIVHSMDGGWVDAHGTVDNPEAMIDAVDKAQETLDYYWANGNFYVGPTSVMARVDGNAVGFHSPADSTPTDRSDNYIVLNSDKEDEWKSELVVHESTHFFMSHDATIESDLLATEDASYTNPEIAKIIRRHNDLAYMHTGLYAGPSNLLISLDLYRRDRLAEARAAIAAGNTREAMQQLKMDLDMGNTDEWILDKAQWITERSVFYAEFGITTEILADDLSEAGLYESEMEKRTKIIDELTKEISEHHKEAIREIQLPPIEWNVN